MKFFLPQIVYKTSVSILVACQFGPCKTSVNRNTFYKHNSSKTLAEPRGVRGGGVAGACKKLTVKVGFFPKKV